MSYQPSDDCPHKPGSDPQWQESDCYWFYDLNAGITGFHRLGQHCNADNGAVLLFIATEDGQQFRLVDRLPLSECERQSDCQRVGSSIARSLGEQQMVYSWDEQDCSGMLTFNHSFYTPRGWSTDESAAGLNQTINDQGHLECTGRIAGTITLAGKRYKIDALAHRDRSWGVRNMGMVAQHRMCSGSFGPALSWASTQLQLPTGQLHTAGFIVRNGKEEDLADVSIIAHVDADGVSVHGGTTQLTTKAGEQITITCQTTASFGHVFADSYLSTENMSRAFCGSMEGFCDLETSINAQHGTHIPSQDAILHAMMQNGIRQI